MKNKFITCLMLVAFGFLPIIVNAACTYSNQGDAFTGDVGKSSSGEYGTGKMFYIDAFELKDNVLTMSGYAYLKGWTNIVSDGGNLNEYCYTKDGGGYEQGQYQKNVTYEFQLYSKSRQVSIPVPSENIKYDHWSGDLFRSTCPFYNGGYNCYWKMSKLQRNNYLTPHYRGGFKIEKFDIKAAVEKAEAEGVNVKTADDYALQIKIKVTNVNNSKGYADWTDIECSPGKACSEWIDFHGYVKESESKGEQTDDVYLYNFHETEYGHSMANRAHPKKGSGSSMTHCSGVMLEANNTSNYKILDRSSFYIKGNGYPGYKIQTNNSCSSGTVKPGTNDYNIHIPAMWLEVSGSLKFHINGGSNVTTFNYNSNFSQKCPSEYPIKVVEDRVFLMKAMMTGEQGDICRGGYSSDDTANNIVTSIGLGEYDLSGYELYDQPIISKIEVINDTDSLDDYLKKYSAVYKSSNNLDNAANKISKYLPRSYFNESTPGSYILYTTYNGDSSPNTLFLSSDGTYEESNTIKNSLVIHDIQFSQIPPIGFNVIPEYRNEEKSFMDLRVLRSFRNDTIMAQSRKKLCNSDGTVNSEAVANALISKNGHKTLLQPAIVNIAYCAKDDIPDCPEYNPISPTCQVQTGATNVTKGSFYETDEAHLCFENFDNVDKVVEKAGFKLNTDKKYCSVVCLDDVDMELPGKKAAYSGTYFNLDLYDGAGVGPKITMKRSCYAKVEPDKLYNDIANNPIQAGESEEEWKNRIKETYIDKLNQCFTFSPGLFNNSSPDVVFNYDDAEFKDNEMFKDQHLNVSDPIKSGQTVISKTTSESISSRDLTDESFNDSSKYVKEDEVLTNGINCGENYNSLQCTYSINGSSIDIADIHYIKKTETKTWNYNTKDYFVSVPTGNVSSSENDSTTHLNNNSVPVSLKTVEAAHNYSLLIDNLSDNTRRAYGGEDFNDKLKNYDTISKEANKYTCSYNVVDDIVKIPGEEERKKVNYFYRTIDVNNPLPQKTNNKHYGYNWNINDVNVEEIVDMIRLTSNYQILIGAPDSEPKTEYNDSPINRSDHFSFRLTPSTMASIRNYNTQHHYDDNSSLYIEQIDPDNNKYYYKSKLLDCLGGKNPTDACNALGLDNLINVDTTSDNELLEPSRNIIKAKNDKFIRD